MLMRTKEMSFTNIVVKKQQKREPHEKKKEYHVRLTGEEKVLSEKDIDESEKVNEERENITVMPDARMKREKRCQYMRE